MHIDTDSERPHEVSAISRLLGKRIVTIGGGTGPFAVLSNLKRYPCSISAVVTMSDSGGSSRRLMDELGMLPVGDLRQALVALSRRGSLWREVFAYRFKDHNGKAESDDANAESPLALGTEGSISGHSLGNLILTALNDLNEENLLRAIEDAQELLDTAGRVIPVTLQRVVLCAKLVNGETICGETEIDTRGDGHDGPLPAIDRIYLEPSVTACDDAVRALRRADMIIIGPGDLYTSVLPNLLVDGIAEAIRASDAEKVYICNLMTKHGETDGFRASDFIQQVHTYLGEPVDRVVLHDGSFPPEVRGAYSRGQQHPVEPDIEAVRELVGDIVMDDLVTNHALVRHDPTRLLRAIFAPPTFAL
jgi:uncharacterized cofD-like protein